jgi:hypothetical protein
MQPSDQVADFFVGFAGNSGRNQGFDFVLWPANASRPESHRLGPKSLGDPKV